jgi:hypothetical protein
MKNEKGNYLNGLSPFGSQTCLVKAAHPTWTFRPEAKTGEIPSHGITDGFPSQIRLAGGGRMVADG